MPLGGMLPYPGDPQFDALPPQIQMLIMSLLTSEAGPQAGPGPMGGPPMQGGGLGAFQGLMPGPMPGPMGGPPVMGGPQRRPSPVM